MAAQAHHFLPCLPAVGGAEQRRVLGAGVDRGRVVERRLQVPDPGELPGPQGAVVPGVRPRLALVSEIVADRRPGLPAIVGALDKLAEPPARLGSVKPLRVSWGPFQVVDLPPGEVGPSTFQLCRLPSDVSTKAPFLVPTKSRTPLIA